MDQQIFRKKSLERISSPEQLQDYMHVTSPGIWLVLTGVILVLAGLILCSAVGSLETVTTCVAEINGGQVTCVLSEEQAQRVEDGMSIRISGHTGVVDVVYRSDGDVPTAMCFMDLPDGNYKAEIVLESISPISFLLNQKGG